MFGFQIFSEIRPVSSLFFVFFEQYTNLIKLFWSLLYKILQNVRDTLNCALLKILLDKRNARRYNKRNETAMTSVIQFTCLPFLYFLNTVLKGGNGVAKGILSTSFPFIHAAAAFYYHKF